MKKSENILNAVFNSLDDVWFFVSPEYRIKYFNQKAFDNGKNFHGRELRAGDNILDYARDTQNQIDSKFVSCFERALLGENLKVDEEIVYNSSSIWTRSKYTPVYENGALLGISIIVEDITLEKTFENDAAKQQAGILELSNKREEFVNVASHELKTPLTSLKASLQLTTKLLENGAPYDEVKGFLDRSSQAVGKLINLVRSLLDTNKITSDALTLEKSLFKLSEVVESYSYYIRLEGKHIVRIEGEMGVEVYADRDKIEQVIVNLINNAVKYAPGSLEIIVKIEEVSNNVRVSVSDFGPGIPSPILSSLFKKYFQANVSNNNYKGMGLGLYIAEGIVRQHNGEIGVDTELGKGSTFWFELPLCDKSAEMSSGS